MKAGEFARGNGSDRKIASHDNSSNRLFAQVAHVTQNLADGFPIGSARLEFNDNYFPLLIFGCISMNPEATFCSFPPSMIFSPGSSCSMLCRRAA
jgi:hypothetical protein